MCQPGRRGQQECCPDVIVAGSDVTYVSSLELIVPLEVLPENAQPIGPADVTVTQSGFPGTLTAGFRFHGNFLHDVTVPIEPGSNLIALRATLTEPLIGFSVAADFAGDADVDSVELLDCDLDLTVPGLPGAVVSQACDSGSFWLTVDASMLGASPIAAGIQTLAEAQFSVGGGPGLLTITHQPGSGSPSFVDAVLVAENGELMIPGVEPNPELAEFLRGDVNGDGTRNISDPIALIGVLFSGGPSLNLDCPAIHDANDDVLIDIADPIFLLSSLFGMPAPPVPPPSAECGLDFTTPGCSSNGQVCP